MKTLIYLYGNIVKVVIGDYSLDQLDVILQGLAFMYNTTTDSFRIKISEEE